MVLLELGYIVIFIEYEPLTQQASLKGTPNIDPRALSLQFRMNRQLQHAKLFYKKYQSPKILADSLTKDKVSFPNINM